MLECDVCKWRVMQNIPVLAVLCSNNVLCDTLIAVLHLPMMYAVSTCT